jgi:hypothetical protein
MPATRTPGDEAMRAMLALWILFGAALCPADAAAQQAEARKSFRVKYAVEGAVYLDAGQNAGLRKDMKLTLKRPDPQGLGGFRAIAEVQIVGVGSASAVCEIRSLASPSDAVQVGDIAFLSSRDAEDLQGGQGILGTRKYPQVVTFTEGDPLDEEQRAYVPRPPLPEINRARGRIGMDYTAIHTLGSSTPSPFQVGLVLRADMTRIGGTYWNFGGYSRGLLNSRPGVTQPQTLTDVINRTYTLGFSYANPQSRWVAGFGRLYLPWAVSLSTIDGGYFGRRLGSKTTAGLFAGSTPDPAAWDYNPNRQTAGTFANYETGSFDSARFSGTAGVGVTRINWNREREFAFTETGISYKRYLSIYHSLQADMLPPDFATLPSSGGASSGGTGGTTPTVTSPAARSPGLTQSFLTVRIQPNSHISFDLDHNYFRNPPTFDPRLVGTGLVEKFLFEGLSGGVRVELLHNSGVYSSIGRSSRTGDARHSLNQLYGIFLGDVARTGIRADVHYSKFDSSFGHGTYEALSLSRQFREALRWEVLGGQQNFVSALTQQSQAQWINSNLDWFVGRHYFLGGGFTLYRGGVLRYNQWLMTTGYRF